MEVAELGKLSADERRAFDRPGKKALGKYREYTIMHGIDQRDGTDQAGYWAQIITVHIGRVMLCPTQVHPTIEGVVEELERKIRKRA